MMSADTLVESLAEPVAAAVDAAAVVVNPSAISLLPPLVVLAIAIWLKRPILALVMGAIAGMLLVSPAGALSNMAETSLRVMQDETIGWLILVCGGFGSLIALLVHTGGAFAFGRAAQHVATGRKSSMLMTCFLGIVIFVDDYLNALTVGETMKRITDKYKVSREMLAYIVDSTAAPICVLIPISTWAVFFGGLLVANDVTPAGDASGIQTYISAIPYMLYAWLAMIMVLLVILGVVPVFGPMRKAELAAQQATIAATDAPHSSTAAQDTHSADDFAVQSFDEEFEQSNRKTGKLHNFLLPMIMLVGFTIWFDIDVWQGLLMTFALTLPLYLAQRLMNITEMMDVMIHGFKTMLPAICTVIAAFVFKDVCDQLGLPQFIIDNLAPYMSAQLLPALVFFSMAILAFATGSSWGIFAVSIPIVMPLAFAVEADIPLVIGALLSASSFGSQACFYSDSTVLAAQGSGCNLMSHALTQFPYAFMAAVLAFFGFLALA
ncbi:Na+/H+ antiporter NhaC family protein [Rheinheimera maricola]|uniref:Sodium:proton antiporter n=1 Tax=Rheinheimera maricola TaxID=2793282 RepID=A0ABS7XA00_9GAMM|nr:Na+/H+ antiporter NhaC family protein [Rheinheimera maricola]MBZ9612383.1 sodium:proton antiporter [Rheinheimera maricola]